MRIECLAAKFALETFQAATWRRVEDLKKGGGSHRDEFSASDLARFAGKPSGTVRPCRIDSADFPFKLLLRSRYRTRSRD
jgi:hypothetical protein